MRLFHLANADGKISLVIVGQGKTAGNTGRAFFFIGKNSSYSVAGQARRCSGDEKGMGQGITRH